MPETEKSGCLSGWLVKVIHVLASPAQSDKKLVSPRIMVSNRFISPAEKIFYNVLKQTSGNDVVIFIQVSLKQLFFLTGKRQQVWENKMRARSIDFLLCDSQTLEPLLGIELDDRTHQQPDRVARDNEVDMLFEAAKLPLLHVACARTYDTHKLAAQIREKLKSGSST